MRYEPLLKLVLGREPTKLTPAVAAENRVITLDEADLPALVHAKGGEARGLLLDGVTAADMARLDFYELGFDYVLEAITVETGEGRREARAYRRITEPAGEGATWDLSGWATLHAAATLIAAAEYMDLFGTMSPEAAAFSYNTIRMRADTWLRAQHDAAPRDQRKGPDRDAVQVVTDVRPYTGYFSMARTTLSHRRFDGGESRVVAREALMGSDAVTVLPYDPVRDRVLLIEQFRYAVFMRGDARPWTLEPIAGRMDPGERPEDTARREAMEEAGIVLGDLYPVSSYYPSPAAFSEYIYSFVALADLPDGIEGIGGVDGEEEDILGHLVPFKRLMQLLDTGEVDTAPLVVSALWLAAHRDRIRSGTA